MSTSSQLKEHNLRIFNELSSLVKYCNNIKIDRNYLNIY